MDAYIFCKALEQNLNKTLTLLEKNIVENYVKNIHMNKYCSKKLAMIYHMKTLIKLLANKSVMVDKIDMREIQKKMILDKDYESIDTIDETRILTASLDALFLLEISSKTPLSKAISPAANIKYNYLYLDSNNCLSISDTRDKFVWTVNHHAPVYKKGIINVCKYIRNITAIRLGRTSVNHGTESEFAAVANADRFGIEFEEFVSQAFISQSGFRYQFVAFQKEDQFLNGGYVLSPYNCNSGWFRLKEKLLTLDKLTMSMINLRTREKFTLRDGLLSVTTTINLGGFATDTRNGITASMDNPVTTFVYTMFSTTIAATYLDYIYNITISGLNSGDAVYDASVNGQEFTLQSYWGGDIMGFIGLPVPTTTGLFSITLTAPYNHRFLTTLEILSEDDTDTNYDITSL